MRFGNLGHNFGLREEESGLYSPSVQMAGEKKILIPKIVPEAVVVGDNNGIFLMGDGFRRPVVIRSFLE